MSTVYITKSELIKSRAISEIQGLYGEWEIKIGKPRKSSNQERYWHKLLSLISDETGEELDDVKLRIKYAVLPLHEVMVGNKAYLHPGSSTNLTKKAYSELIEATMVLGQQLGFNMPLAAHFGLE